MHQSGGAGGDMAGSDGSVGGKKVAVFLISALTGRRTENENLVNRYDAAMAVQN
jgi:hypothetical protein